MFADRPGRLKLYKTLSDIGIGRIVKVKTLLPIVANYPKIEKVLLILIIWTYKH